VDDDPHQRLADLRSARCRLGPIRLKAVSAQLPDAHDSRHTYNVDGGARDGDFCRLYS
jgi:hypothetical protein